MREHLIKLIILTILVVIGSKNLSIADYMRQKIRRKDF